MRVEHVGEEDIEGTTWLEKRIERALLGLEEDREGVTWLGKRIERM